MKEIVVMSGKGGTGKTTITAALGVVAAGSAVVADCDVDASNLHLLYRPEIQKREAFYSKKIARIDYDTCIDCGICQEKCVFDAIDLVDGKYVINEMKCEGCSVCHYLCPDEAIAMEEIQTGDLFLSRSRFGGLMVHAKLGIGQDNSGKLVTKVKSEARTLAEKQDIPVVLVDGPPGVGCPAISSFSGASHVLIVTEATNSGLHDLKRLVDLKNHFQVEASCVINKSDLNPAACASIEAFCREEHIPVIAQIPYSATFYQTLRMGHTLMESTDEKLKDTIKQIWNQISELKEVR